MSSQSLIIATGETQSNEIISDELNELFDVLDFGLYHEDILTKLEKYKPHILILADGLTVQNEEYERIQFIRDIRRQFPGTRIVYIYDSNQDQVDNFLKSLVQCQVFDFLSHELDINRLIELIKNGKDYLDVKKYEEFHLEIIEEEKENAEPVEPIAAKEIYISQKQKTIAFFSPNSTGKSFIAQNTAVKLAQNDPSLDVVLLDFDFNQPKIATRMKLNHTSKNNRMYFEELLQRIDGNRLDAELLNDYLFTHPKYSNLKIFDCEFKRPEYKHLLDQHHIEQLFEIIKEEFHVAIIDMNRDIELIGQDICLKKASRIYFVLDYDFSNNLAFQKLRVLLSQIPYVQKKEKYIIVNMACENSKIDVSSIISFYKDDPKDEVSRLQDHLHPNPIACVPMMYEFQMNAIYDGNTLVEMEGKAFDNFKLEIEKIVGYIHPMPISNNYTNVFINIYKLLSKLFKKDLKLYDETVDDMFDHS